MAAPWEPWETQSKPLDNVAVTLTEQHFDRASESRAEIFPVAAYTSIGTWRTMAREAATRHSSCCDFGSRAAVRCTLICPRYLLRVMSPEDQRSVYICDNTLIGWCVDSAVPHTTCKKDKKKQRLQIIRFDLCALPRWKVDCSSPSNWHNILWMTSAVCHLLASKDRCEPPCHSLCDWWSISIPPVSDLSQRPPLSTTANLRKCPGSSNTRAAAVSRNTSW